MFEDDDIITKEKLDNLVKERLEVYSKADEAVAAFNRENELSKEYNGRQILELIQNADDANATTMSIKLDREGCLLTVSNNGDRFSYNGIKSIMIANLSSKVTSYYIGNKGLGFRSLLVWSDDVSISTSGFRFQFSRKYAREKAETIIDIKRVCKERGLAEGCCPFPMLGIPDYEELEGNMESDCIIAIHYDDRFADEILEQINKIEESSLFFLKTVREIGISDGEKTRTVRITKDGDKITANGQDWQLRRCAAELPGNYQDPNKLERKKYNIMIAIPSESDKTSFPLYNYLPTSETVFLPYILHATLELNSSRNNINLCDENKFILGKAAELISEYVDEVLNNDEPSSWYAYNLMTPRGNSSNMIETCLYDKVKALRDQKQILPTLQGKYVNTKDYYFYSNEDSEFWQNFGHYAAVSSMLQPLPDYVHIEPKRIPDILLSRELNREKYSIAERAHLINHIIRAKMIETSGLLSLLVDENEEKIKDGWTLFTPRNELTSYTLPDFVKIQFLHRALFKQLVDFLSVDNYHNQFKTDEKSSNSRWLARAIRDNNIGQILDHDIDQVLKEIISQTSQSVSQSTDDQGRTVIKEMVRCLFDIYTSKDDDNRAGFNTTLEGVKLIDSESSINDAAGLLFDTPMNRRIFGADVKYLATIDFWDITEDELLFSEFFKKLGVNALIEIRKVDDLSQYSLWLEKGKLIPDDDQHRHWRLNNQMGASQFIQLSRQFRDSLEKLSLSDIICLFSDDSMYQSLNSHQTLIFQQRPYCEYETEYSFLRFQLLNLPGVKDKIFPGDAMLETLDDFVKEIPAERVTTLIGLLTTNIKGKDSQSIVGILNSLADNNVHQRVTRKVYKAVIDADVSLVGYEFKLLTVSQNGSTQYISNREVYYTDNAVPLKIVESTGKSRLCYASRAGEDKVCKTFGLEKLSGIEPGNVQVTAHRLAKDFKHRIEIIKPYVLLHCIQNVNKTEEKKALAARLRNSAIEITEGCLYQIDGQSFSLAEDEFIAKGSVYYINASQKSTLQELYESVEFCTAVAEILSIVCKVNGRNDSFVSLFQNITFMKQKIRSDFSEDEIKEANELMGMSREEYDFFSHLLKDKGLSDDLPISDIHAAACSCLGIESFPFAQVDWSRWNTAKSYELLSIVSEKKPEIFSAIDLSHLHKTKIDDIKREERGRFIHVLWKKLSLDPDKQREYFSNISEYDNLSLSINSHKFLNHDQYVKLLHQSISQTWRVELEADSVPHGSLYPQCAKILNELSPEEKSILCFEGHEEEANSFVLQNNDDSGPLEDIVIHDSAKVVLKFLSLTDISSRPAPDNNGHTKHGAGKAHNRRRDIKMEKAGKKAELLVKQALENNGCSYRWRSGYADIVEDRDDTLGYDFEYKESNSTEDRFLEVKNFSSGGFLISSNEMRTATDSDNSERYDIALVVDEKVFIIKNFFKGNNYTQVENEYAIYLNIEGM